MKNTNRETFRLLKFSFDSIGNIIESNKFYYKEMAKMEDELTWTEHFIDKLVFTLHALSSNHSQSWTRAFAWIFSLSFFYISFLTINHKFNNFGDLLIFHTYNVLFLLIMVGLYDKDLNINSLWKFLYANVFQLGFLCLISDYSIINIYNKMADKINPFSIMNSWDEVTFDLIIFKIIIAYLIYQLIISVRQNTRRS